MITWFTDWIKRSPLVAYFVLVFGIEWLLVFTLSSRLPPMIALLIGSWLPNSVGLLVTGVAGGQVGLRKLLSKVVLWRISPKWYVIALFMPITIAFITIILYMLIGNPLPDFAPTNQLLLIILIAVFTGAMGEELGWRGTALPRLQARWNALISSLILGVLWGLYHLPSFLLSGMPLQNLPLLPFMLAALGLSIIISWTFNQTCGSLITAFLYHFAFNFIGNATSIFVVPALFWLFAGICSLVAIVVITLDWTSFTRPARAYQLSQ